MNSYITKFISIVEKIPTLTSNDNPLYWCKINNDKCVQGCGYFNESCQKRYIKNYSYMPFKSIYVLPQFLTLLKSTQRETEIDNLVRAFLYSISVAFGDKSNPKVYFNIDHNNTIGPLIDKNRFVIIKSLFGNVAFKDVESEVRTAIGLKENRPDSFDNVYSILLKIYTFIDANKKTFVPDDTRQAVFTDFVDNMLKPLLLDKRSADLFINSDDDFTSYITAITDHIVSMDTMLMKFPDDLKDLEKMSSEMLKMIQSTKQNLAKLGGGPAGARIDPREILLSSENSLFKRIAVDTNLYEFYKANNKTRLINNVLFWKWVLAYSLFAGILLRLPDDHAIQTMDFNDTELTNA